MSPQWMLDGALVGLWSSGMYLAMGAALHLADLDTSGAIAAYDRAATLAVDARRRSVFGTRASALRARSAITAKPASSVAPSTRSRE